MVGKTATYYKSHPAARKAKQAYDVRYNKSKAATDKRVALNKFNRQHKEKKGNNTDAYHKGNKIVGYKSEAANRGSKVDSAGDRRSRGGKARTGMKFRRRSR